MNIDCPDCDPEWCAKHVPVTMPSVCPGELGHPFTALAEGVGWCKQTWSVPDANFCIWANYPSERLYPHPFADGWYSRNFRTLEALNDWFIANVIKEVVAS